MKQGIPRKCCPLCGQKIVVSALYQYSRDYETTKKGKLSTRYRTVDCGPMEVAIAACKNPDCDARWDSEEFSIEDSVFVDYKYSEGGDDDE